MIIRGAHQRAARRGAGGLRSGALRALGLAAIGTVCLAASSCGGPAGDDGDVESVQMGVVPQDNATETFDQWSFFIDRLEEDTGLEVDLYEATDLAAVIEATIAGDLDIVHLGPFGQMIARDNGAEITAVGATAPTSAGPDNASVAVVRDDSSFTEIEDLEGEDVCFVNPSSATGYLFGAAAFMESGIDPEADVESIFIGDHGSAVRSMYDGECAAVFTVRDQAEVTFFENNPDVSEDELRIIWSEEVPEGGISISTALPDDVQETLTDTMLELNGTQLLADDRCPDDRIREDNDGEEFCATVVEGWWGIEAVDDDYWEPIREVCEITRAPACEE